MATIKFNWVDKADNESEFVVYKSASSSMTANSEEVCIISYNGSTWDITTTNPTISNLVINSNNSSPVFKDEPFDVQFDDSAQGTLYYGVASRNAASSSDVVPINAPLTI